MLKTILYWIVVLVAVTAIYGTYGLALNEWNIGDICPKILGIPACYIVMICFVGGLLSHLFIKNRHTAYFIFIGIVTSIALTGTVGELTGLAECPRTSSGIPMCFISLGICVSLLLSKVGWMRQ